MCKYRLDRSLAGLEDSGPYLPKRMHRYCFRWDKFGKSKPISVDVSGHNMEDFEVKKGHLVSIERQDDGQTNTFHFTRLPSPLTGMEPNYWAVDIPVSDIRGWDICPLSGLLAVATVDGPLGWCVCLKVLTIKSPLTVRTRYFEVKLFRMDDRPESDYEPKSMVVNFALIEATKIDLLLTSHRVAAMIRGCGIAYVWALENGQLLVSRSITLPKNEVISWIR